MIEKTKNILNKIKDIIMFPVYLVELIIIVIAEELENGRDV